MFYFPPQQGVLWNKKDKAIELFEQGKGSYDPEVKALGLTRDTRRRYYRDWKDKQENQSRKAEQKPDQKAGKNSRQGEQAGRQAGSTGRE